MIFNSPTDAMPWVGFYIAAASLICTLAMAADVILAFWQWKLWFPNRFFTLNAATITLIAITMKLPVDLTSEMSHDEQSIKLSSLYFLITMLANFLPSLGLMDGMELLTNMVALGILIITIVVNIGIQFDSITTFTLISLILSPFSIAMTVLATRKSLEHRYKEAESLVQCHQEKIFSFKVHTQYVKKYWMMAETHNPQFVIACSPVSSALGVVCLFFVMLTILDLPYIRLISLESDYKWSMKIIDLSQSIGIIVGSIAPVFRCFTSISHYSLSMKWSINQINVFRVEKHWIKTLQLWKNSNVYSHIPGRYCKIVFHSFQKAFLNFCLMLHIMVLVICKTICLIPRAFLILLSCCWYLFKSCLKMFKKIEHVSTSNVSSEIDEYTMYVIQIEEKAKLSNRILRNTLHSITQLLNKFEKKEPNNLMTLLGKSKGFSGVEKFNNDQVPPLYPVETHNCWSLVLVTLTSISIALPKFENGHFKGLLDSMREALKIVTHIEDCLNVDDDLIQARKATKRVWIEIEVYRTWLQMKLEKKAHEGKTSTEILKWLGDEAAKIVIQFKSNKKPSIDHSPYKFILASSMYRISQTILLQCNEQENLSNDEELLEWISTMIADILTACFTNIPRVIKMKCHQNAIENRGNSIRNATQLLGKSRKILKMLKSRQLRIMDLDSMAYIDKWCVLTMSQMPNGGVSSASPVRIERGSSNSNESVIVTVV